MIKSNITMIKGYKNRAQVRHGQVLTDEDFVVSLISNTIMLQ